MSNSSTSVGKWLVPFLSLFVFVMAAGSAAASTYYVSNSGSNSNDGMSPTSAWKTISKVQDNLGSLQPGDSVLFERGGIWYESLNLSNNGNGLNGSPGLPITFGNYGSGNLPIIDGGGTVDSINHMIIPPTSREFCIQGRSAKLSYITIDGFECRNTISWGIAFTNVSLGSAGITVQNCYIHDTGNGDNGQYHNQLEYTDFKFWSGAAGTQFLNNKVGNCYGHNCIEIHGDSGSPLIRGNECYQPWHHNCIDMHDVVGAVVDQNVVHDVTSIGGTEHESAFYLENCGSTSSDCPSSNPYFDTNPADVTWTRNVVYGPVDQGAFQCQNDMGAR